MAPKTSIPLASDPNGLHAYTRNYAYDKVGNITSLQSVPVGGTSWTRNYTYVADTNRLATTSVSGGTVSYSHDVHGNITSMPHLDTIEWDYADQMRHVDKSTGNDEEVWFVYDASGNRVRKVYEHGQYREERLYLGGVEVYRKSLKSTGVVQDERETVHLSDDHRRVCMAETKTITGASPVGSPVTHLRFQLDNHLGTCSVEVTEDGSVISYEEYHPYGTSAYRAQSSSVDVSAKRYRYTGKERDDETGLYYHGARYYAPWLGRWTAADPLAFADGTGGYTYARNEPTNLSDPSGRQVPNEMVLFPNGTPPPAGRYHQYGRPQPPRTPSLPEKAASLVASSVRHVAQGLSTFGMLMHGDAAAWARLRAQYAQNYARSSGEGWVRTMHAVNRTANPVTTTGEATAAFVEAAREGNDEAAADYGGAAIVGWMGLASLPTPKWGGGTWGPGSLATSEGVVATAPAIGQGVEVGLGIAPPGLFGLSLMANAGEEHDAAAEPNQDAEAEARTLADETESGLTEKDFRMKRGKEWKTPEEWAEIDHRQLIDETRPEQAGFEGGRHHMMSRAMTDRLRELADKAERDGVLPGYVERLREIARTYEKRAEGSAHRGGGRGSR